MPRRSRGTVRPGHHQRERQAHERHTCWGRPNGPRQKCELMCVCAARVSLLYASGNGEHAPHLVRTDGIGIIRRAEEVDVEHHGLSGARSTTHHRLRAEKIRSLGAQSSHLFLAHSLTRHHHTCHRTVVPKGGCVTDVIDGSLSLPGLRVGCVAHALAHL